ncbi:Arrestin domain containing [Seminavis robusta]|uniref:Arrestin domain containing n=1 Tax=Seminavis robusta TaxID=568900 RepID=A0A9N8E307_9STRA|nr:Arrestin domain containing [Seminavis robusta]|eukprot:Sro504_g156030.1 Arrestin domain containing (419) ;mRNA; r:44338-45594
MKLYFVIDQTNGVVRAGEKLSGRLIIRSIQPVRATNIALYFRGKEYTAVQHNETRKVGDNYQTVRVTSHGKHQFFRMDMPVPNLSSVIWNGKTVRGQHEVPFEIKLPRNLPSSMQIEEYGDSATIAYCLRAKLTGSGFLKNYQATQSVNILARAEPAEASPYIVQPTSTTIRSFGLVRKGEITYGAKVPVTKLAPGQKAEAYVALINNSGKSVKEVKVELTEVVQWSAHGHYRTVYNRLWTERFSEQHFTGSQKLDKESLKKKQHDANRKQKSYRQVLAAVNDNEGSSRCTILVPQGSHESFRGTSIKVSHTLRIKMRTKFGATNPEFSVPIDIVQEIQQIQPAVNDKANHMEQYPIAHAEPIHDEDQMLHHSLKHTPSMNPDYTSGFNEYNEPPTNPNYRGMSKASRRHIATPAYQE